MHRHIHLAYNITGLSPFYETAYEEIMLLIAKFHEGFIITSYSIMSIGFGSSSLYFMNYITCENYCSNFCLC